MPINKLTNGRILHITPWKGELACGGGYQGRGFLEHCHIGVAI